MDPRVSRLLVNRRFGLITRLVRAVNPPDIPGSFILTMAYVADVATTCDWFADRTATGTAFDDEEAAQAAAIGEAVERYCGNILPPPLPRASFEQLRQRGQPALDPQSLCLYSARQYAEAGFPFVPFTPDLPVEWLAGEDLLSGTPMLLPAPLCYLNYYHGWRRQEPPLAFLQYAGIAAGTSRADAEGAALEELIERDTTTLWWLAGGPTIRLTLEQSPGLRSALTTPGPSAVELIFLALPCPFGLPVIATLLLDHHDQIVTLGVACRLDPEAAARKAAAEALALRVYAHGLLTPEGDIWRAAAAGMLNGAPLKPFRADRRYADDYRPDFRDLTDLSCHAQIYLDPRLHHFVAPLTSTQETLPLAALPSLQGDRRAVILERLAAQGLRAYSADLTTVDVAQAGLRVVRVIVPGLYGNFPAAFPLLGGQRLYHEPVRLGWRTHPLTEAALCLAPLPHT
ncbi:MAG: YcaO-like family protein [Chloroflexi bacterium]|nr:YcaO-like family protein [Chloroflexota bacterium]